MARRRSDSSRGAFSRPTGYPPMDDDLARPLGPLDHPASRSSSPRPVEPWRNRHSTPTLMRTVPDDRNMPSRPSPVVRSRSTGRSRSVRLDYHPLLDVHPVLTQRSMVCARRAIRREVLFALKGTGKGSKARRNYTRSTKTRC